MAYDAILASRIRALMAGTPGVTEKKLFGGLGFLVNGHLAVSAYKDGDLMIRCGKENWQNLLSEEGARPMTRNGAPVSGWVIIASSTVENEEALRVWVERGRSFAAAQPD